MMNNVVLASSPTAVLRAVDVLAKGGLVGLPTETVYGLGARADLDDALAQVFALKGRPTSHPLILHIGDLEDLARYAVNYDSAVSQLVQHCWPGPLTVLLHKSEAVSMRVTGNRNTVAIRIPANETSRAIIRACGFAVAAPSANLFGHVSPTSAAHVIDDFGDLVDLVVDDGHCSIGVESTIIDFTNSQPQLLRPGGIPAEDIEHILGHALAKPIGESRASGMLASHYAPHCQMHLVYSMSEAIAAHTSFAGSRILAHTDNLPVYAATLYAQMRQADIDGIGHLIAVLPVETGLGTAISDRLMKAAQP